MDSDQKKTQQFEGTETFYSPQSIQAPQPTPTPPQPAFNPYASNPYEVIAPPPPPKKQWKGGLLASAIAVLGFLLISLIIFVGIVGRLPWQQPPVVIPTQSSTSAQTMLTPTLNVTQALQSDDFSLFIKAFAQAMASRDYTTIQKVSDTQNFQEIALDASGHGSDWNYTYNEMMTGNFNFTIAYPPITAEQEGYTKCGYGPQGISNMMVIDAAGVQYVVGTTINPTWPADAVGNPPRGTVFVFELPNGPTGESWLWRAVIFNSSIACV